MGEALDRFKAKALSLAESFLSSPVEKKGNQELGPLNAPVFREIPAEMKGNAFIEEGMKGWAYAAISAIADDVSANPAILYKRQGKDWAAIDYHPMLDLINRPNPYQTREEVLWLTVAYLLTIGECMWVLDKSINPKSFVVFNPARATVNFSDQEMIGSYTLSLSDGKKQEVPAENVVFFKLPSFKNPFRGSGVMEHIAAAVDVDNFAQEYIRIFFYNNALPNATLQTEQEVPEAIAKRLIKQFEARHRGVKNSHKLALLDRGLKFTSIDKTFSDMQMTDMEIKIRDRILAAFRVPKSILGIIDEVNRANAEASDRNFSKRAVMPKLRFIQAQINQHLVPKYNQSMNIWFEFENPVMEDELTKAQVRQINIFSGVRTADEYREEDGLKPIESGDPADNGVVDDTEDDSDLQKLYRKRLSQRINRSKYLNSAEKTALDVDQEIWQKAKDIVDSKKNNKTKKTKEVNKGPFLEADIEDYHQKKVENSDRIEKDFSERVWLNYKRQKKDVLMQITGKRRKATSLEISFNEEEEAAILAALSFPYMERSILAQAGITAALLNIDNTLNTQDNRVKAYMKKWTGKLGKTNAATTKDFITKTLRDWGNKEDATIADLKKTLSDYFDDRQKADMIARTEVSRASGFSTETVYKDAGAVGKKWSAAIDERVCEWCSELDGKMVSIGENFLDSGETLVGREGGILKADYGPVPAEPSHPNCRCDIVPVFDFDKAASFSFVKMQKKMMELDHQKKELENEKSLLEKEKEKHLKTVDEELKAIEELKSVRYEREATEGS